MIMPLARASNALCGLRCNGIGHRGECAPKRFGHLHPAAFPKNHCTLRGLTWRGLARMSSAAADNGVPAWPPAQRLKG